MREIRTSGSNGREEAVRPPPTHFRDVDHPRVGAIFSAQTTPEVGSEEKNGTVRVLAT